jgi:hypothetical protein
MGVIDRRSDYDPPVDLVVTIPSKRRQGNMAQMLSFFPDAHVYVDEVEKGFYAPHVPEGQLRFHESLPNQVAILKHILATETAEYVLFVDDDLQGVSSFVETYPKMRKYNDAASLARIVRNLANLLCDLNLGLGGWNLMAHPGGFNPLTPFVLTGVIRGAMLFRGRDLEVDDTIVGFDMDLTLQSLLKHRVVLKDMRFHWDFGVCQSNAGGNQAVETYESTFIEGRKRILDKWGSYIKTGEGNIPMASRMKGSTPSGVVQWGHNVTRRSGMIKAK